MCQRAATCKKYMEYKRDRKGRFSRAGKWIIWVGLAAGLTIFAVNPLVVKWLDRELVTVSFARAEEAPSQIAKALMARKVSSLRGELIEELAKRENAGGVPGYLDDNSSGSLPKKDKISYGCMAYKISTVQRHYKELYGAGLSNEDAVVLAVNCEKAKALADRAIFELGAVGEWSAATASMKTKVGIIRELMQ